MSAVVFVAERRSTLLFKVNLAHLFVAGISSMAQLGAIGFDVRRHLSVDYRPVLPVYVLATAYDLSYDKHMRGVVSPQQIAEMNLSKREMRLLGITVGKLIETRQCTAQLGHATVAHDQVHGARAGALANAAIHSCRL